METAYCSNNNCMPPQEAQRHIHDKRNRHMDLGSMASLPKGFASKKVKSDDFKQYDTNNSIIVHSVAE